MALPIGQKERWRNGTAAERPGPPIGPVGKPPALETHGKGVKDLLSEYYDLMEGYVNSTGDVPARTRTVAMAPYDEKPCSEPLQFALCGANRTHAGCSSQNRTGAKESTNCDAPARWCALLLRLHDFVSCRAPLPYGRGSDRSRDRKWSGPSAQENVHAPFTASATFVGGLHNRCGVRELYPINQVCRISNPVPQGTGF
jgi:hypothetical protein